MPIEDALAKLTAAVEANTAALNNIKAAAGAKAGTATATTAAPKANTAKPAGKAVSEADLRKAAGDYLSTKDAAEREERKANVAKITAHFGIDKLTSAPASEYGKIVEMLKKFTAGEVPEELASGDEAGSEDDTDSMI